MTNKTPEYTRKAIEKYNSKFDRFTVNIPKGYKEIIRSKIGMTCGAYINMLVVEDLTRRGLLNAAERLQEAPQRAAEIPPEDNAEKLPPGLECPF